MSDYFNATGTIGFTCDNCGRELLGCTWVNGMKFCAKCYQETFGASKDWQLLDKDKTIAEQRKQIADLEEKLEEKDLRIEELESQFAYECECNKQFVNCQNENDQLKQQLAESEKKILELQEDSIRDNQIYNEELKYYETLLKRQCNECKDKDKISFAVEQLEKVKEVCSQVWGMEYAVEAIEDFIDNQIKAIKGDEVG